MLQLRMFSSEAQATWAGFMLFAAIKGLGIVCMTGH